MGVLSYIKIHVPQDTRKELVKLKVLNPGMNFRVEKNLGPMKERIQVTESTEQGLEENDVFFVELEAYRAARGEPDARDIVWDVLPNGTRAQGVNVQMGPSGWYKRINRRTHAVNRESQINDDNVVDTSGDSLNRMHAAAKKMVLRDSKPSVVIDKSIPSACALSAP